MITDSKSKMHYDKSTEVAEGFPMIYSASLREGKV